MLYAIKDMKKNQNNRYSLRENIYRQIKEDIIHGRINAGERLQELELAKRFHVSRTPIREALVQLGEIGLVNHQKNVGAIVLKTSLDRLEEYFALIAILEQAATELVVNRGINAGGLSFLNDLIVESKELVEARDYSRYLKKDREFHTFFTKQCGNRTLHETVSDLRNKIFRFLERGFTLSRHIELYIDYHQKIVDAVSKGRAIQAGKFMREHILHAKTYIIEEQING